MIEQNFNVHWLETFIKEQAEDVDGFLLTGTGKDGQFATETISHALIRRYVSDYIARLRMAG